MISRLVAAPQAPAESHGAFADVALPPAIPLLPLHAASRQIRLRGRRAVGNHRLDMPRLTPFSRRGPENDLGRRHHRCRSDFLLWDGCGRRRCRRVGRRRRGRHDLRRGASSWRRRHAEGGLGTGGGDGGLGCSFFLSRLFKTCGITSASSVRMREASRSIESSRT